MLNEDMQFTTRQSPLQRSAYLQLPLPARGRPTLFSEYLVGFAGCLDELLMAASLQNKICLFSRAPFRWTLSLHPKLRHPRAQISALFPHHYPAPVGDRLHVPTCLLIGTQAQGCAHIDLAAPTYTSKVGVAHGLSIPYPISSSELDPETTMAFGGKDARCVLTGVMSQPRAFAAVNISYFLRNFDSLVGHPVWITLIRSEFLRFMHATLQQCPTLTR